MVSDEEQEANGGSEPTAISGLVVCVANECLLCRARRKRHHADSLIIPTLRSAVPFARTCSRRRGGVIVIPRTTTMPSSSAADQLETEASAW